MALLEKSLIIKKSTIPGAGNGLFAGTFIPKGSRIVEYKGKICTWKEVDHDEGRNGYIYYVKRYHVIDARYHENEMARYANDAQGLTRVKGIRNNCEYNIEGLRVFIDAKKDIPAGAEILVDYGREYWSVIRYNNRLLEKEKNEKEKEAKEKNGKGKGEKEKAEKKKIEKSSKGKQAKRTKKKRPEGKAVNKKNAKRKKTASLAEAQKLYGIAV
ncbi:MAG: SET domain-containing protein [Puia sp.]|nr:SET domain-containing protein [Puia sp.]